CVLAAAFFVTTPPVVFYSVRVAVVFQKPRALMRCVMSPVSTANEFKSALGKTCARRNFG
ncbi:hypothetical protein ACC796_36330, partial [Rhizobium ruizarguesonis]